MVRIAKRIGTDDAYRTRLRERIAAGRMTAPLFDTVRFARNFETAVVMMVQRHRDGLQPAHVDVPDCGPVERAAEAPAFVGRVAALQTAYASCPLCDGVSVTLGFANCATHALWHEPLPTSIEWLRCADCAHVHRRHFWTEAGLVEVIRNRSNQLPEGRPPTMASAPAGWSSVVEKAVELLGGYHELIAASDKPMWVDIGTGDGSLIMAASDYGFAAIGLDTAPELVTHIQQLGFNALNRDFMTLPFEITPRVLSMMDVLQQMPFPREALSKAAQILPSGGVLIIRTPDFQSSSWKLLDAGNANSSWMEIEHYHYFCRERLISLLQECDFDVAHFTIPNRSRPEMELYAVRRTRTT
jgi:SAM-dependent methyltransferase